MSKTGPFAGTWRIVDMELWDQDAFDLVGPAHFTFGEDGSGRRGHAADRRLASGREATRSGRGAPEKPAGHPEPEFGEQAGSVWVRVLPSGYVAPHRVAHDLSDRDASLPEPPEIQVDPSRPVWFDGSPEPDSARPASRLRLRREDARKAETIGEPWSRCVMPEKTIPAARWRSAAALLALTAIWGGTAEGALNDDFADRAVLEGPYGRTEGDTRGATREPGEPAHAGSPRGGRSVWWRWTPESDGTCVIHTLGSDFDTLLAVYTGDSVGALTPVAASDDVGSRFGGQRWQSLVSFGALAGTEYEIAVDGHDSAGTISLTWFLDDLGDRPAGNDDFARREVLEGSSGTVFVSTRTATREEGEPEHDRSGGGRSAWWRWVCPADGTATIDTSGSSYDTVLAVYTGDRLAALEPVGANDNAGGGRISSRLVFEARHRTEYQIAADGYGGDGGVLVLTWSLSTICRNPSAPSEPEPADGATGVDPFDVQLRWSPRPPPVPAARIPKVIYGPDDRREYYEVTDPRIRRVWEAVCVLVSRLDLINNGDGTSSLPPSTFADVPGPAQPPLCAGERFRDQPAAGVCSGFLVARDLVVTAGHCVQYVPCGDAAFIFGYHLDSPGSVVTTFDQADIYHCRSVVASEFSQTLTGADWAVVQLNREVRGFRPVAIRRLGEVRDGESVFAIGHPAGLPAKFVAGARVLQNDPPEWFGANLDHLAGNSGSPVFNASTYEVEGVLVRGPFFEFVDNGFCSQVRVCRDDGADCGVLAECTRTTWFERHVPPLPPDVEDPDPEPQEVVWEVYLARAGEALSPLGEAAQPRWNLTFDLEQGASYAWQVVARVECGFSPGPIWTFTAGQAPEETPFRRGDIADDGSLNLTDAVKLLLHLFQSGAVPSCQKSADTDDSGGLNLTDAVLVLNHLFRGGPPPEDPFAECGTDRSADDLTCERFAPCE